MLRVTGDEGLALGSPIKAQEARALDSDPAAPQLNSKSQFGFTPKPCNSEAPESPPKIASRSHETVGLHPTRAKPAGPGGLCLELLGIRVIRVHLTPPKALSRQPESVRSLVLTTPGMTLPAAPAVALGIR